jgi:hypothetical protein
MEDKMTYLSTDNALPKYSGHYWMRARRASDKMWFLPWIVIIDLESPYPIVAPIDDYMSYQSVHDFMDGYEKYDLVEFFGPIPEPVQWKDGYGLPDGSEISKR